MADCDLSRYRFMASYILTNKGIPDHATFRKKEFAMNSLDKPFFLSLSLSLFGPM